MKFDSCDTFCRFNEKRDIMPVQASNPMRLSEILSSGVVPPDSSPDEFNPEVSEVSQVGDHVTDVFEAVRLGRQIEKGFTQVVKPSENSAE